MRKILLVLTVSLMALPGLSSASLDPNCVASSGFALISGKVMDATNAPLNHILINVSAATAVQNYTGSTYTNSLGVYSICVQAPATYEVRATDINGVYETKAQEVTSYLNVVSAQSIDFNLPYRLYLTVSPNAFRNTSATTITIEAHSSAPISTSMTLELDAPSVIGAPMTHIGPDGVDPVLDIWRATAVVSTSIIDGVYFAKARGKSGSFTVTTEDRVRYTVDKLNPKFAGTCGPLSPTTPTTNPRPRVKIAVCDTLSGVDASTITMQVTNIPAGYNNTPVFVQITGVPAIYTVTWIPNVDLPPGVYHFAFAASDLAGNSVSYISPDVMTVVTSGGSPPNITSCTPPNVHLQGSFGLAFGFGANNSYPKITCYFSDVDGQYDLVAGSLSFRLFYNDQLVASYNPNDPSSGPNASTGTGYFFQDTGYFSLTFNYVNAIAKANGGGLPGIYTVVASISDHGRNSKTYTYQFTYVLGV